MENEIMNPIEETVVTEGEEIIIEAQPDDAIDVVVEEEVGSPSEPVQEVIGELVDEEAQAEPIADVDADTSAPDEDQESPTEKLSRKCREIKYACCDTIDRIIYDLKETNFNPYIKQTRITRVEIYRNCNEETPIDSFEMVDTKSYSAKALMVASAAAALLVVASNKLVKKLLK